MAAVLVFLLYRKNRWFGVTLTPDEAIVHNLPRRRIAWREVRKPAVWRQVVVGLLSIGFAYELFVGTIVARLLISVP